MLTESTVSISLMIGSMIVALLALYYLLRAGKRLDPMCMLGILSAMMGLNLAARATEAPGPLWTVAVPGVLLFLMGLLAWREGFRRLAT